jgi:HJR/Mrr/RecB family endonuclease
MIHSRAHHCITNDHGQSRSAWGRLMAVVVTAASGYDLAYVWRGQGQADPEKSAGGYYMNAALAGEADGRWFGPGAEALGLVTGQVVERGAYDAVYRQVDPRSGEKLGRAPGRYVTYEAHLAALTAAEPHATAGRVLELEREAHRLTREPAPYTDVTVSFSKSISVLHASIRENARRARQAGDEEAAAYWDGREVAMGSSSLQHRYIDAVQRQCHRLLILAANLWVGILGDVLVQDGRPIVQRQDADMCLHAQTCTHKMSQPPTHAGAARAVGPGRPGTSLCPAPPSRLEGTPSRPLGLYQLSPASLDFLYILSVNQTHGDPARRRLQLTADFAAWVGNQRLPSEQFFRQGLVVLDANVLLDLYRITPDARTQVLASLKDVIDRLWVPYQAAIEFSRNRKKVVTDRISSAKQTRQILRSATDNAVDVLERAVERLLSQRDRDGTTREWNPAHAGLDRASLVARLDGLMDPALAELDALTAEHDLNPQDMQGADPLLAQIDELLADRIGPAYGVAELRALVEEAHIFRFPNKIPPGYLDDGKETQLRSAGDYLVWRQTIDKALQLRSRDRLVILITKDAKGDWWDLDEKRQPRGPRPELVQEMRDVAMADLLLLSLKEFMAGAKEYLSSAVSDQTLQELRRLYRDNRLLLPDAFADTSTVPDLLELSPREFEDLVHYLLIQLGYEVDAAESSADGGFDFLLQDSGGRTMIAEAKRYRGPITRSMVRELQGALFALSADSAMLITTGAATSAVLEELQNAPIELVDGPTLIELLASVGIRATIGSNQRRGEDQG